MALLSRRWTIGLALAVVTIGRAGAGWAAGGETCATATPIAQLPYDDSGDTTGHTSDTSVLMPTTCSAYATVDGPDLVYTLELGLGNALTFTVTPSGGYDPSIYLYEGCGGNEMCVQGADAAQGGQPEVLTVSDLPPGTYFFYVDAFYASPPDGYGAYALSVTGQLASTTTTSTATTSTTLPTAVSICAGGGTIDQAFVKLGKLGGNAGNDTFVVGGTIATSVPLDPATHGAQLLLEDLGGTSGPLVALVAATAPVPPGGPGSGCGPKDGWKKLAYKNTSGALDPPACPAGSARGLSNLRFKDRRAKGGGVFFRAQGRRTTLATPTGPLELTIVFSADAADGLAGACATHAFAAGECAAKKATYRCR